MPENHLEEESFAADLYGYFDDLRAAVCDVHGDWTVKGFIDVYTHIYTLSLDTKVLSKVMELLLLPVVARFANERGYRLELARQQNHYPDITLTNALGFRYAVDVKTTYRTGTDNRGRSRVAGMTLGTYGGYFRGRSSLATITYPYESYSGHFVLGVVYTRIENIDENKVYNISELGDIPSVAKDFVFFLQEKYRIASDSPGSGNTKNIGSTRFLDRLTSGSGVFSSLGVEVFDDYWMNYRTSEMARGEGFVSQPYRNLREYKAYKEMGAAILAVPEEQVVSEAEDDALLTLDDDQNPLPEMSP